MNKRHVPIVVLSAFSALGLLGFALTGLSPKPVNLGGEDRFLTHVTTDKPIYRPGESLYARGVILNAFDRKPLANPLQARVELKGPKGDVVASGWSGAENGVVGFRYKIPDAQPGGLYSVRMSFPNEGYAPASREFEVRAFRPPRLKSQIVFLRDGYAPGDDVTATLSVERAEGGHPEGAAVTLVAMVDGREVARQSAPAVDGEGHSIISFRLPNVIERGEGTLALTIQDGGVVETATKTIPILLQTLDLALYPEGGYLVAGLPCRLYVEAKTPAKKPADIAGVIETAAGKEVARFATSHEGRGIAAFKPMRAEVYRLRVIKPGSITKTFPLPAVADDGAVIQAQGNITMADAPVRVKVGATNVGAYKVVLSSREKVVAERTVSLRANRMRMVALPTKADGVLRVTILREDGMPLAERLVFRRPAHSVKVSIEPDRKSYSPGETVTLKIKTTSDDGTPIGATVGLAVTDDTVLELLETRDQPPRLESQVLLESHVLELKDAGSYLAKSKQAARNLDLLLGTQGWRRFAFYRDVNAFLGENQDAARNVLAFRQPIVPRRRLLRGGAEQEVFEKAAPGALAMPKPVALMPAAAPAPENLKVAGLPAPEPVMAQGLPGIEMPKLDAKRKQFPGVRIAAEEMLIQQAQSPGFQVFRVYAHKVREQRKPNDRVDFTDTLYWNAGILTDAGTGTATVSFDLSDAVTSFRVFADAFTADGLLGAGDALVASVKPFYLEPKLPIEVTFGDTIRLPISIVNGTLEPIERAFVTAKTGAHLSAGTLPSFPLEEGARVRRILDISVKQKDGVAKLVLAGEAGAYSDTVTRTIKVAPKGFPTDLHFGGMLRPGDVVKHDLTIPKSLVRGSLHADIKVYPTSLAKLQGALKRLIREPNGCFEQTSSTTYPLVMAQQYFLTHQGVDPSVIQKSKEILEKGYKRLTGFECKRNGYEWFGEDPGHETLSAYGLLEFTDMAKVKEVDQAMLERTRAFVLATRDGKGGFKRKRRALHTWITDPGCSNAYILWSLLETGAKGLDKEVDSLLKAAKASKNSYVVALAANVMELASRQKEAAVLLSRLAKLQAEDGSVTGATTSIVGSSGVSLKVETTALATLAWLDGKGYEANVENAIRFLAAVCQDGRYGSTQSTVLALRAIVEYDRANSRPKAPGTLTLLCDGRKIGKAIRFDEKNKEVIQLPNAGAALVPGKHTIAIRMDQGSAMPYSIEIAFHSITPASSPDCPLALETDISGDRYREGDLGVITALVRNKLNEPVPTPIAIVGLPGGFEPNHEKLKELVKSRTIAAYEVLGRDVVLYWRSLGPAEVKRVPISVVAAIPGHYRAPASRAYLYYGDEAKTFIPGVEVEIAPK